MLRPLSLGLMMLRRSGDPRPPRFEWIVVLEAAADANASLIDRGTTEAILRAVDDDSTVALHSPDRFAVQLPITEADVERAFIAAIQRWRKGAQPLLPRGWSLVRAEIITREEFDRDA